MRRNLIIIGLGIVIFALAQAPVNTSLSTDASGNPVWNPAGLAPMLTSSPSSLGQFGYNTNTGQMQTFAAGIAGSINQTIFQSTGTLTYANSTATTSLVPTGVGSLTLPSGFWVAGRTVRIDSYGVFSTAAILPSLNACFKVNATSFCSTAGALVSSAANYGLNFNLTMTCVSVTSNTCTGYLLGAATFSTGIGLGVDRLDISNSGNSTTWPTNSATTLDVTGAWSAASSSNSIKTNIVTVRVVN
jgi:hypothetical protein